MSFKIHSIDDNRISGIEYLPCGAITPKVGMALVQSGGNLALATGTNAPTYISMCEKDSPCTAGDIIPVIRVNKDMIFDNGIMIDNSISCNDTAITNSHISFNDRIRKNNCSFTNRSIIRDDTVF